MKTVEAAMRSVRAGSVALLYALIGLCATTGSAATVMATTGPFRLSIKHDGIRPSTGDEELAYSSLWDGGDGATVAIAQDGAAIAEGLAGEGERAWSVARNGMYTLTHTTYTNGVAGKIEAAAFIVTGRDVPFGASEVGLTARLTDNFGLFAEVGYEWIDRFGASADGLSARVDFSGLVVSAGLAASF